MKNLKFYFFFTIIFLLKLQSNFNFASQDASLKFTKTNSLFRIGGFTITDYNGTLNLKDDIGTVVASGGADLFLSSGILKLGNVISYFTGEFQPNSNNILMRTDDVLNIPASTKDQLVPKIIVLDNADSATILGSPFFSQTTTVQTGSKLNLGISTELNQSITGSGTITLLNDLTLASGIQLPAIVDLNGKKLHITGGTMSSAWGDVNTAGGVIELHSNLTLNTAITLGQSGATDYTISGNGNTLNLSSGSIEIQNASSNLRFSNMIIKGLTGVDAAAKLRGAGTITFSNCTLVLAGNYQRNDGDFIFSGDSCKVITNGLTFTVDQSGVNLNVDGIVLEYEQLNGSGNSPFFATNSATITNSNGGSIRSTTPAPTPIDLVVDATSYTFTNNFFLTSSSSIEFNNDTVTSDKNINADGNGHAIYFPKQSGTFITVDENVDLTLSDIVLKDFNHKNIALAPATTGSAATLSFGDNCLIEMNQDLTIASGDAAWSFTGNSTIDGSGHTLRIEKQAGITISGASKNLTLKNMKLEVAVNNATANPIEANSTDNSKITLQDCDIIIVDDNGFILANQKGSIEIKGIVNFYGSKSSGATNDFKFQSDQNLTVLANSELIFQPGVAFTYDPEKSAPAADKEHLIINAAGGVVEFNGSKLIADGVGVEFQSGTVRIKDKVTFQTTPTFDIEVDSAVNLNFSSGAVLDVDGPLKYIP